MLFPSQKEEGVHINISGLGILKAQKIWIMPINS